MLAIGGGGVLTGAFTGGVVGGRVVTGGGRELGRFERASTTAESREAAVPPVAGIDCDAAAAAAASGPGIVLAGRIFGPRGPVDATISSAGAHSAARSATMRRCVSSNAELRQRRTATSTA